MDEFTVHLYSWQCCTCGTSVTLVRIGVTSRGELLASWFCSICKKRVLATVSLEQVIAQVPPSPQKLLEAPQEDITSFDENFLKEMRIICPKD